MALSHRSGQYRPVRHRPSGRVYHLLSPERGRLRHACFSLPFSPFVAHDLRDSLVKYNMQSLKQRPRLFRSPNKTRLKSADEKGED